LTLVGIPRPCVYACTGAANEGIGARACRFCLTVTRAMASEGRALAPRTARASPRVAGRVGREHAPADALDVGSVTAGLRAPDVDRSRHSAPEVADGASDHYPSGQCILGCHPEGVTGILLRKLPVLRIERRWNAKLAALDQFMHSQNRKHAITEIRRILTARTGPAQRPTSPTNSLGSLRSPTNRL
jgi:hypothetical protein